MQFIIRAIQFFYNLLWGDLFTIPLPGGGGIGISLLVLFLIPTGIYFTIRTKGLLVRLFPEMIRISGEKKASPHSSALSGFQSLIVSTATRVGMGNLVGVVAAVSLGGAGAVFWMWVTAFIGSSTAYVEATLAQLHKRKDPLYGGYQGGPAYYIHDYEEKIRKKPIKKSVLAAAFAISGLICWFGISQVIGNSVSDAFWNAFHIPPIWTTCGLVILAAIILILPKATVKALDIIVPVMAAIYFIITLIILTLNITQIPDIFRRIFAEAFGFRQAVAGGFGAVLMNGVKRGLFSNEAGSGSAPCAAAAAETDHPAKVGLLQAFGVFIDTIVICSCTAFILLLLPETKAEGLQGMALLQAAMSYHLGQAGIVFIAITVFLFSFSTFLGVLYYARSNIAYLFGSNHLSQTIYKGLALIMLFIGGLAAYQTVWDLGDVGIGLMTIFNIIILYPMGKEALDSLKQYEQFRKEQRKAKKAKHAEKPASRQ
ncbi:MAG: alanine:cation symporter family protein [Clostridia bacterium]|nr:alanine:cation symporter family protein [Clostridia bacterium]